MFGESLEIILDSSSENDLKERHKLNNLVKWNSEITVKVLHLRNTFVYMFTYLDRFRTSNNSKDQQYFKYFNEIITYYFISIRDNILQLINVYIDFPIKKDYNVTLGNIKEKLKGTHENLLQVVIDFENKTNQFREKIRNGFTHKTNPLNFYYMTDLDNENNLGISYSETIDNDDFYNLIIKKFEYLSHYVETLREMLK